LKAFFIPDEMFTEMTKKNDLHGGFLIYHLDSKVNPAHLVAYFLH